MRRITHRSCRPHRRGNVLVMVAILIFALLPIASFVLQSGWLTLTRQQMQTGTDIAALESLRLRDALQDTDPMTLEVILPVDSGASVSDFDRRRIASDMTRLQYDDDLDPSQDVLQMGAGPVVELVGGTSINGGSFQAGRRVERVGAYKPTLRPNVGDDSAGDFVAGTYGRLESDGSINRDEEPTAHTEANNYTRDDFRADGGADAMLVRLRRSDEPEVDNVRSSGPRVPLLFGRGPFGGQGVAQAGETDFMTYAERGTVVRATSIADAVPAWAVGHASPDVDRDFGVANFAVNESEWRNAVMTNPTSPSLTVVVDPMSGQFTSPSNSGFRTTPDPLFPVSIGSNLATTQGNLAQESLVYVPLTTQQTVDGNVEFLVCGFVPMRVDPDGVNQWVLEALSTSRPIAARNAAATLLPRSPVSATRLRLASDQFRALNAEADVRNTLLHTPALRRAVQ